MHVFEWFVLRADRGMCALLPAFHCIHLIANMHGLCRDTVFLQHCALPFFTFVHVLEWFALQADRGMCALVPAFCCIY